MPHTTLNVYPTETRLAQAQEILESITETVLEVDECAWINPIPVWR